MADELSKQIGTSITKIYKPLEPGDPEKSNGTKEKMIDILNIKLDALTPFSEGLKQTIEFLKL